MPSPGPFYEVGQAAGATQRVPSPSKPTPAAAAAFRLGTVQAGKTAGPAQTFRDVRFAHLLPLQSRPNARGVLEFWAALSGNTSG
jgi:hypothetical protein